MIVMKRINTLSLLPLICVIIPMSLTAEIIQKELTFANISVRDGLSHVHVFDIYQDKQGFMWFATGDGLNRYDGYGFVEYKHSRTDTMSLSHNVVLSIIEDNDRNLWVGTARGLNRINLTTGRIQRYASISGYTRSLCLDPSGRLWISSGNSIYRYEPETDSFFRQEFGNALEGSSISAITQDSDGDVWVAIDGNGLLRFNPETMDTHVYRHDKDNPNSILSDNTSAIFEDSQCRMWIGFRNQSVCYYDRIKDSFVKVAVNTGNENSMIAKSQSVNNLHIRSFGEEDNGNIWIGTMDGLLVLYTDGSSKHFVHSDTKNGSLSYNSVFCIFKDLAGSMWLGTYGGGVNLYSPTLGQFKLYKSSLENERGFGHIGPMLEHKGKLWIGTEGAGLVCYNINTGEYNYYDNYRDADLRKDGIRALCFDDDSLLWVGTNASGVLTFDVKRRAFIHHDKLTNHSSSQVNDIYKDSKGNLWMGITGENGLLVKKKGNNEFRVIMNSGVDGNTLRFESIRPILELSNGEIWVGSIDHGIFVFHNDKFLRRIYTGNTNINCDFISFLKEDTRNRIWICTHGGGLNIYDLKNNHLESFSTRNGLPSDNVCWVTEDRTGNFWVSTMGGLSHFNYSEKSITHYTNRRGNFPLEILSLKSGLQAYASNNTIYIGGHRSFASFTPEEIIRDMTPPSIVITKLMLHNIPVQPEDKTHILDKTIEQTSEIVLKHNQTDITLDFVALNYIHPQNNLYSYKLDGYDKEWTMPSHQRSATYTNIPPGTYKFHVRACNSSGVWNEEGVTFNIEVLLPPWKTWWAWCLYIVFVGGVIYLILSYYLSRIKMRNNINMKQLEKQTLEKSHNMQITLFTNFSHELRTPLTLILDPLKNILSDNELPVKFNKSLNLIQNNAEKILLLVNQLMDFRKTEAGQMSFSINEGDIVNFINDIAVVFRELASSRGIQIQTHSSYEKLSFYFDPFLMEKVFFNILSNAIKNTPDNGFINIKIDITDESKFLHTEKLTGKASCLYIIVSDTGIGIPQNDIERIFDPFFQVSRENKEGSYGTGVGLHLTKSIIALHHGVIWAESIAGQGASFHIELPLDKSVYTDVDFTDNTIIKTSISDYSVTAEIIAHKISSENTKRRNSPVILIIDDNTDICSYIKDILNSEYTTYEAGNGEEGLKIAQNIIPDLILSDIMMPAKDGLELVRELKLGVKTSHIPIILLTAKSTVSQIKEGLASGADDYITKPFYAELLKAKISTIIANRNLLKEAFLKSFSVDLPDKNISNKEELFLTKAYDFIRNNLNNSNLSIEMFSKGMQIDRTHLYRRLKDLTGMGPSLFINTLRLKVAAELLTSTDLSVSEIAYKVGFESASYFATSFKRQHGVSPTEYIASKRLESK